MYFAARRVAQTGGRLALLYIMPPAEFQHWMSVEEKMRDEAREEAEEALKLYSSQVQQWTNEVPTLYVREGKPQIQSSLSLRRQDFDLSSGAGTDKGAQAHWYHPLVVKCLENFQSPLQLFPVI